MHVFKIFNFISFEWRNHTSAKLTSTECQIESSNILTALATVGATNNFGVMLKILLDWLILFSSFSCPPRKGKPTEYSWNRVVRTVGYKFNLKSYLFNKHKTLIITCHFSKKESTLDNGMKPFWWKYSVGLNQNLNRTFEINSTKRLC